MTLDERIERLFALAEIHDRQIEANGQRIEATRQLAEDYDRRLEGTRQLVEANSRRIEETRQLAEDYDRRLEGTRQLVEANSRQIEANSRQIGDLRAMMAELRESQALLVQVFSQQQDEFIEFRRTTNATLDRIDLTLNYLRGRQNNGNPE